MPNEDSSPAPVQILLVEDSPGDARLARQGLNRPRKDGCEVLREIKEHEDFKTIPVIILTTSPAERDINSTYALHANSYITKPLDFLQFLDVVKSIEQFWFSTARLPIR